MPDDDRNAERARGEWSGNLEQTLPIGSPRRVGSYTLIDELGRGGMGEVFTARRDDSDTVVAVKLISGRGTDDPKFRRRFLREARTAAAVMHPNIARVHGVFEDGNLLYIVMDYIPGGTLRTRINQQPVRDLRWILTIAKQIAQGLAAAHRAGVIHRDIKPSNILLDPTGEHAWIADFGLAMFELGDDSLTSTGNPLGTPAYMSPEQARGEKLDKRSDLFSLGCLIYAMVAGHSPFQASSLIAVMRRLDEFTPPPLNAHRSQVPAAFSEVVDRLLKKDPKERYNQAENVIAALERCEAALSHGNVSSDTDAPTLTVPTRTTPRRRSLAIGLALVVGLLVTAWRFSKHPPQPEAASQKRLPPAMPLVAKANSVPTGPSPAASSPKTNPPAAALVRRRWTVSVDRPADFTSLQDALRAAHPYDSIEVLDQATYEGPFVIDDPYRLEGVQLTSSSGATLTARSGEGRMAVLTIDDTRRVRVNGFRLLGLPYLHTVSLRGNVSGTLLSELKLEQPAEAQWANVLLSRECRGTADEPITIRECRLESGKYGIYSGRIDVASVLELSHVLVDGNSFSGSATHIVLLHSASEVRIEHNVFRQGVGIEFHLESPRQSGPFSVCNNTFFQTGDWVLFGSDRGNYGGIVSNNLIVASTARPSADEFGTRRALWKVDHNVWEAPGSPADQVVDGFGLTTSDAGLQSRDPDSPNFLRPSANGIAATRGAAAPLPEYVGARRPQP